MRDVMRGPIWPLFAVTWFLLVSCVKVGPDFVRPEASLNQNWIELGDDRIDNQTAHYRDWWQLFDDPVLNCIVDTAYRQNPSLQIAGARVLEARAQLGIAVGQLFPQTQQVFGNLQYNRISDGSAQGSATAVSTYALSEIGFLAAWELDFWGRYRRLIESAKAGWQATLADYDNALVSLIGDAAGLYIQIRTIERRLDIANRNARIQADNLRIAEVRWHGGTTTQRDVEQAKTALFNTQASIPALQSLLQQAKNGISILLGLPPGNLVQLLGSGPGAIPAPPPRISVGIPADLLRRRPDIRSAEYQAMAQSAQIGAARADLFPAFSLSGAFSFMATDMGASSLSEMSRWGNRNYVAGPNLQWNILNYGRLVNNVRVQDARLQQLLISYQNTVLTAQREVEDALSAFLRGQEQARFLAESTDAARRSLELAVIQYREGVVDFTTVLIAQQALLTAQDSLAATLGSISTNMVGVFRALGGGWQLREGEELLSEDVKHAMAKRTRWGDLLHPAEYIPN